MIKQIWLTNFNLNLFSSSSENKNGLINLIRQFNIVNYLNFYKNKYFAEYLTENFIKTFSPLFEGKEKFQTVKDINYTDSIRTFMIELKQNENLDGKFYVSKEIVKFDFVFYCILSNCTKNILQEKTLKFQRYFRRFKVRNLMKKYIEKVRLIQRNWREHKYLRTDDIDRSIRYILTHTSDMLSSKLFKKILRSNTKLKHSTTELTDVLYIYT